MRKNEIKLNPGEVTEIKVEKVDDIIEVAVQSQIYKKTFGEAPTIVLKPTIKLKLRYLLHDIKTLFKDFIELFRRE